MCRGVRDVLVWLFIYWAETLTHYVYFRRRRQFRTETSNHVDVGTSMGGRGRGRDRQGNRNSCQIVQTAVEILVLTTTYWSSVFEGHNLNLATCWRQLSLQDSWEDEEEEKKDEEKKESTPAPPPAKSKKKIHEKIAEKEVCWVHIVLMSQFITYLLHFLCF